MSQLPTPEEICELDTFSLEETIEAIEALPRPHHFGDLLRLAKLQLIDRLAVEDFGRQLANDQYQIEQVWTPICPPIQQIPLPKPAVTPQTIQNRKQIFAKMQLNLQNTGSYLVIGRPPVNPHYKPKPKKLEPIEKKTKDFLKAKRSDSKPKFNPAPSSRSNLLKQPQTADTTKEKEKEQVVKKSNQIFESKSIIKQPVIKEESEKKVESSINQILVSPVKNEEIVVKEMTIREKLMKQVKQMEIGFKENDAYDDVKQITLIPINLVEEESKILKEQASQQRIPTQIQQEVQPAQIINVKEKEYGRFSYQQEIHQQIQEEIQGEAIQKVSPLEVIEIKPVISEHNKSSVFTEQPMTDNLSKVQSLINSRKTQNSSKQLAQEQSIKPHFSKQVKSKSVRTFSKKMVPGSKNEPQHLQMLMTRLGTRTEIRPQPKQTTFPYHQIVGSFLKLFPHSKSLLVTLRNVEESLRVHIDKQISQKSLSNEYLRRNQYDLTFKVISDSQRAQKHANLFGIGVDSYLQRASLMVKRLQGEFIGQQWSRMLYRVVRSKEQVYDIVNCSFQRRQGWFELAHGLQLRPSWNVLWTWSRPQVQIQDLFLFQKMNHFLGNKQIARKDLLKKNIELVQRLGPRMRQLFDIIPDTYLLPGENIQFIRRFRELGQKEGPNLWILKPVGLSRGRGISLVSHLQQVVFSEPVVLQRYLPNPFLLNDRKFDMRIYVLVTSINPLQAFLYKEGFARVTTQPYSLNTDDLDNKFVHLTNFSIQRQNLGAGQEDSVGGSKLSLKMLAEKLQAVGVDWSKVEKQIEEIIVKSLVSCMNSIPQNPNCFQLFGYDIILDSDCRCWLLEVNSSPSLQKEFILDEVVKQQLVDDIFDIVSPIAYDRTRLLQVIERRRREAQGLKSSISTSGNSVHQLNQDLHYILHGKPLRRYGQAPPHPHFKQLAPSPLYQQIVKALQQYKIDPIIKPQI